MDDGPARDPRGQPGRAPAEDSVHRRLVGEHQQHHLRPREHLAGVRGDLGAGRAQRLRALRGPVPDHQGGAGRGQAQGHGPAHHSETDESDVHGRPPSAPRVDYDTGHSTVSYTHL